MNTQTRIPCLASFRPWRRTALLAGAAFLFAGVAQALPAELSDYLKAEDGPFEVVSAILLAAAAIIGWVAAVRAPSAVRFAGAAVTTALLLRELDFQKRFTYRSIESVGFYTRPIAPVAHKVIALGALAALGTALLLLARAAWRHLPRAIRSRERWVGTALAAGAFVSGSLTSEKFLGFTVAEEVLEAGFAGAIVVLAWQLSELGRTGVRAAPAGVAPQVACRLDGIAGECAADEERRAA